MEPNVDMVKRRKGFLVACDSGDVNKLQELLDSDDIDVNTATDDGTTGLQIAAANGHETAVRFLLRQGASAEQTNAYGWTPLMQAARTGHSEVMRCLIKTGAAAVQHVNKLGADALTCAARSGHVSAVKVLLESYEATSDPDCTAVMVSSQFCFDSMLGLLLEKGCDLNRKTDLAGHTALMLAALNGHRRIMSMLVEYGADPYVMNAAARTALDYAVSRQRKGAYRYLYRLIKANNQSEDTVEDLFGAVCSGNVLRVQESLARCLNDEVNSIRMEDGATPLVIAAIMGNLSMVKILLGNGALVDYQDEDCDWTALMQAAFHGHKDIVSYLLSYGADASIRSKDGYSAFDVAVSADESDPEMLRMLTERTLNQSSENSLYTFTVTLFDESRKNRSLFSWMSKHLNPRRLRLRSAAGRGNKKPKDTDTLALTGLQSQYNQMVLSRKLQSALPEIRISPVANSPSKAGRVTPLFASSPLPSSGGILKTSNTLRLPYGRNSNASVTIPAGKRSTPSPIPVKCLTLPVSPAPVAKLKVPESDSDPSDELYGLLKGSSVEKYYDRLKEQQVDVEALALLNESDLQELSITSTFSKDCLLEIIAQLRIDDP